MLGFTGLGCLLVITLASPGATRMFAWPWSLAFAGALLAPALALVLRAFDSRRPLALPGPAWCATALACAAVALASALASPHRDSSLQWSAPLLAAVAFFFVAFDALQATPTRRAPLARFAGFFFVIVVLTSLALWAADLPGRPLAEIAAARNPYPLGHSNFTAGFALLALPWLAALAWRARGAARTMWGTAAALTLPMLVSSGSRGGLIGLAALAFTALILAPLARRKKIALALACALAGLALALAHPRTRAMFAPAAPAAAPNISNVQRTAMLTAGWRMGLDRPLLGWGPGTTPLVFPRYRAGLDGGAENVLQLHNTPAQLWSELGLPGAACAALALTLLLFSLRRIASIDGQPLVDNQSFSPDSEGFDISHPLIDNYFALAATTALAGYGVFSITDWQLDVPALGFSLAFLAAWLAVPAVQPASLRMRRSIGLAALLVLALVTLLGGHDPAPKLNVRALAIARDPASADEAIALFRQSLALNPDQEIAHFNLGWLLVIRDPVAAEKHFRAAAHLVPDKGGVYFGLGLARLNQRRPETAARAFALECLNDPRFLTSPWWREPAIAATRDATQAEFSRIAAATKTLLPAGSWRAVQLAHVNALAPTLGNVLAGPERTFFRERTGYPVLMRNLDLLTPTDLFLVRESTVTPPVALPAKGWLPSPLLLQFLDTPAPTIPKS